RYATDQRAYSANGWLMRRPPPYESRLYSVYWRRRSNRSKPAASGRSKSQGSVNEMDPCCVEPPTRNRKDASQPRPRKLRCERSTVPISPSTDETPPPIEKIPVGFSFTSTLTMILVLSAPGCVVAVTLSK